MTTIGSVAQSQPQQSAPPPSQSASPPPPAQAPAASASPPAQVAQPTIGGTPPVADSAPAAPAQTPPATDWRTRLAGDDVKALEVLARYKDEGEVGKAFLEQRAALSKRAEPLKIADNATPEQISEYRKGLGVPEVAKDAPVEQYIDAYKIKAPDGYNLSNVEKGMLGDYAKLAYEQGHSPREVKSAVDFFFQQQAANEQALNKLATERRQIWQGELRDKLGRDYDPTIAAANAYINKAFADNPDAKAEIINAQLPGGGFLGDHPAFIDMIAELARANGFTDRLEASSMESGGKSLEQQQQELESLRWTNKELYDAPQTQSRLDKLIALRLSRGEIDEMGNPIRRKRTG